MERIIKDKIIIKNYKCFDNNGAGFDKIYPINIIIGKNNSGKSSLIDVIRYLTDNESDITQNTREGKHTIIEIETELTGKVVSQAFSTNYANSQKNKENEDIRNRLFKQRYLYSLNNREKKFLNISINFLESTPLAYYHTYTIPEENIRNIASYINQELEGKKFHLISAERNIEPEKSSKDLFLEPNGRGATNYIQRTINDSSQDRDLVEKKILSALNEILEPEIKFNRILSQINDRDDWEIYFEDDFDNLIPLSKMGSGIKTIIQVLINLILITKNDTDIINNIVFAFEELENNLHPALQRRLLKYIKEYSEKYKCYFFITTHSNIVIDIFGKYEHAQLIHVVRENNKSVTHTVNSNTETKALLEDLDIKASDLLQCNGIIWVEGPSDRTYINKWLSLYEPSLEEGIHYNIMFYGGRLLSHLSFEIEEVEKNFIPLLKINTNAFVVMDKDAKRATDKINQTKVRIENEIGKHHCWITDGREIENYIPSACIKEWLKVKHNWDSPNYIYERFEKLENTISKSNKEITLQYNKNKAQFSMEIIEFINKYDQFSAKQELSLLLESKLKQLVTAIKKWNSLK
ncbi:ATP-binding protein [Dysgonomonas sp. HDW5B]|uniref:ATP-dependent nuclease n=1 Tax=Dysgonomonas sp. HDW5B TaxID=2714927 RepID=UPI00140CF67A|nr:ATP-binding protein [Dysgonomonas sp. HDW5B]QIK56078.1 ATP-binding protein [Dysgonomonas sp. HDW5B]